MACAVAFQGVLSSVAAIKNYDQMLARTAGDIAKASGCGQDDLFSADRQFATALS